MLKSWDINLRESEKKTLLSFLALYLFLMFVILLFVGVLYYVSQKEVMLQSKRMELSDLTNEHIAKLKELHVTFYKNKNYPRDERFNSAIYDSSLKQIFSTTKAKKINLYEDSYLEDGKIYFIKELESYYLGARYIAIEVDDAGIWKKKVYQDLAIYGSIVFMLLLLFGYFLLNILLQPMRNALALLDRFIKDTTHELSTPVNAIMSNIEMIDIDSLDEKLQKKIKRINIGARTVANLYQDLTYLMLSHKIVSHDEDVDVGLLVKERVEYFSLFLESKKIEFNIKAQEHITVHIDRKKFAKVVDNILSNAIKYNSVGGKIDVEVSSNVLSIEDTGRGIEQKNIKRMFERYSRFDPSVGGFGIGLSIVSMITKEYGLHVEIKSTVGVGTKVSISW
ncbi:MAG: HAMP domain-containing sensor histidine kinase [Sulfurospirillaceae bacterium]|nr:HAMP domain-containing sensor histidine kinase [Sulfurospirillaceae bacterium]